MDWLEAVLLGVLQGATEFLPVSSSGHLALAAHLFGALEPQTLFDLCLHLGTLVAVVGYFLRPIGDVLSGCAGWVASRVKGSSPAPRQVASFRIAGLVVLASLPAGVVGFTVGHDLEALAANPTVVGALLIANGCLLLTTLPMFLGRTARIPLDRFPWMAALVVGLAQSLAILRGVSRSGTTITAARHLGLSPDDAARLSFFLFIPAILGALVLEFAGGWPEGGRMGPAQAWLGGGVALVTGVLALRLLMRVLRAGKLYWFGPYCIAVGLLTIATQ